jgi:hypothetical protein
MADLRILTLDDEAEVSQILAGFVRADIHFDPRYLKLFQDFTTQRAIYFYWRGTGGDFLQAFFERPLPVLAGGGEKDLLSPWYYGGPIHTYASDEAAQKEYSIFLSDLNAYANANGVVSQFQRLNPALDNYKLYGSDPSLIWNRKVVSIDLKRSLETVRAEYEYKVRKNLRRAEKEGLRVVRGATPTAIEQFKKVYAGFYAEKRSRDFLLF